ncbi:MAG: dihydrolipoyl dehydrogenase [Chlamydiae bacterium RIFCSPHIGHO2_12_FULL_49_11]|nr:MAG: dihydrolipoyl dehydrogenase [Chlamydiae bacterium RIFCSPHIGHO2_12_FULL_49_11]
MNHSREFGISADHLLLDFNAMQQHKSRAVQKLVQGIDFLMRKNKITKISGTATFTSKTTLVVGKETYSARHFIIATGSKPVPLPFLPLDEEKIVSSTGALSLREVPKKLIVIGAGVIGLELGTVYRRLGSEVEIIEFQDRILPEFDASISSTYLKILQKSGIKMHLSTKVTGGGRNGEGIRIEAEGGKTFTGDICLIAIGRRPFIEGLGLETAGIVPDSRGFIPVDANFRTSEPYIFAIGDVIGGPMLAHKGSFEAKALIALLAGRPVPLHYATIPNVVYTDPEIATCGFTESALREKGVAYRVSEFPFLGNSRYGAILGTDPCFVKILAESKTGRILGAHVIAPHASDIIMEAVLAMQNNITAQAIAHTIHAHPTFSEAFFEAALGIDSNFIHL